MAHAVALQERQLDKSGTVRCRDKPGSGIFEETSLDRGGARGRRGGVLHEHLSTAFISGAEGLCSIHIACACSSSVEVNRLLTGELLPLLLPEA